MLSIELFLSADYCLLVVDLICVVCVFQLRLLGLKCTERRFART